MKNPVVAIFTISLALAGASSTAEATIYFSYDAEGCADGTTLPSPPWNPYHGIAELRGTCAVDPAAPQGARIMRWDVTYQGMTSQLNEIPLSALPTPPYGTYYLAFYFRFDRLGGADIWHDSGGGQPPSDIQSYDKAVDLRGQGLRWLILFGDQYIGNQDHRFAVFVGHGGTPDVSDNLNPESCAGFFYQNRGYEGRPCSEVPLSPATQVQLEYERWYALVFKMAWATGFSGEIGLWIDGEKLMEYTNILTAVVPGTFERFGWNGTYAQPAYDIAPHVRKFDAVLFTDDWQDIVNGGYLSSPGSGDTLAPAAPTNLTVQ